MIFAGPDFVNVLISVMIFSARCVAMGCHKHCGGNGGECCLQREQRSGEDQIAVVKV
jgi:hypothetical protein